MKLCKDCKHAQFPNPYANAFTGARPARTVPMCGHPSAPKDFIWGDPGFSCEEMRNPNLAGLCGEDAKLFEEKPAPEPAPDAGAMVYDEPHIELRIGWLARLFG